MTMNLDSFNTLLFKHTTEFISKYRAGHAENPDNWPLEMNEADWVDQFMTWLDSK
jgi:hypothetical protein